MVILENNIPPPRATPGARIPKKVAQSATPAISCALALINPMDFAASGSFKIIIIRPPINGTNVNPSVVKNGIFERRAFRVSAQRAEKKLFMIVLSTSKIFFEIFLLHGEMRGG